MVHIFAGGLATFLLGLALFTMLLEQRFDVARPLSIGLAALVCLAIGAAGILLRASRAKRDARWNELGDRPGPPTPVRALFSAINVVLGAGMVVLVTSVAFLVTNPELTAQLPGNLGEDDRWMPYVLGVGLGLTLVGMVLDSLQERLWGWASAVNSMTVSGWMFVALAGLLIVVGISGFFTDALISKMPPIEESLAGYPLFWIGVSIVPFYTGKLAVSYGASIAKKPYVAETQAPTVEAGDHMPVVEPYEQGGPTAEQQRQAAERQARIERGREAEAALEAEGVGTVPAVPGAPQPSAQPGQPVQRRAPAQSPQPSAAPAPVLATAGAHGGVAATVSRCQLCGAPLPVDHGGDYRIQCSYCDCENVLVAQRQADGQMTADHYARASASHDELHAKLAPLVDAAKAMMEDAQARGDADAAIVHFERVLRLQHAPDIQMMLAMPEGSGMEAAVAEVERSFEETLRQTAESWGTSYVPAYNRQAVRRGDYRLDS